MTDLAAFPLPFADARYSTATPRTLRELEMIRCSALIREKPEWFTKMLDADITARWRREAAEQGMTAAQVDYVLAELAHYAAIREARTGIEVSAVDGVWQSDGLVDDALAARLRAAVRVLEDVPEAERDWHPGSEGQVLDLVHPSLFCNVRGVSGGPEGAWESEAVNRWTKYQLSSTFQWLPAEAEVDADGGVSFASYVNNVHPVEHRELAAVLPELFGRMLPLFERVLTDLRAPRPPRIEADPYSWYDGTEPEYPENPDDEEAMEAYEEAMDDWYDNRRPNVPDAPEITAPPIPGEAERVELRGRRLQVIAKLASIHLTPERPEYAGGSWHVEGMLNERIVSTALFYWDSENITESRLGFRTAVDDPDYEQNDHAGISDVYGLGNEDALNQHLGSAPTPAGRCLAFPNVLQHRVSPFRLADPSRPGHRKILAFFLVDPSQRIVSTSDIPPQQPWSETSTMTLEQAKAFREELMRERKFFVDEHNEELFEREFSLCEH